MRSSEYAALLNNESVLTNAVEFATAHRVFVANLVPTGNLTQLDQPQLDFLALFAFSEFMTATEDLLGWVSVLKEWDPTDDYSLFKLLDKVKVGPDLETKMIAYLSNLDSNGFRDLLHIPENRELVVMGFSAELVAAINESIPEKRTGFLKVSQLRATEQRGLVKGFNKAKHMLLAFPIDQLKGHEILLPKIGAVARGADQRSTTTAIDGARIDTSPEYVSQRMRRTVESYAVLWDTLSLILLTRYGKKCTPPEWVTNTLENWGD